MTRAPDIVSIPGTTQITYLCDNIAAAQVSFTDAELGELNAALDAIEVRGDRAPAVVAGWNGAEAPDA
ncbi:hypothetical protein [uncultured Jannaschia sp.]|uniref:hypothetical protein n=1 Tax=uncultured Jannaschia sp. TaxID=293347 RepID=UPI00345C9C90